MRYLTAEGDVDFDIDPDATWFGSFSSNGAWWAGSQAYGVQSGTGNWDGSPVNAGSEAQGRNLPWSYRHGSATPRAMTQGVRDNAGEINAMFFDGHVARLDDRASRNIEFWYPSGTTANPGGGLTDVPQNYEVP